MLKTLSDSYGRLSSGLDWVIKRRRHTHRSPQRPSNGFLSCTGSRRHRLIVSATCYRTHRNLSVHSPARLCCCLRHRARTG